MEGLVGQSLSLSLSQEMVFYQLVQPFIAGSPGSDTVTLHCHTVTMQCYTITLIPLV